MSLKPDLNDPALTPLGIGPGLFFPQSNEALNLSDPQLWEPTRRHPYYLKCWTWARSCHQYEIARLGLGPQGTNWPLVRACAGVLRGIGVRIGGIDFPDPALSWAEQPKPMREANGASPVTCRELAMQPLARLPNDIRKKVGEALQQGTALDANLR